MEKIQKNQEYELEIIDQGFEGEGIAKKDGYTIFIPQAIQGEIVKATILKVTPSYAIGKIKSILKSSPYRMEPDCAVYPRCGGCHLRHMDYNSTLALKEKIVWNCLQKTKVSIPALEPILGMGNPYYYRNKLQYPVGFDAHHNPVMGVYAKRSHVIIPHETCQIQNKINQLIAADTFAYFRKAGIEPYDEKQGNGELRHIVVRNGNVSQEVMLVLVLHQLKHDIGEEFIQYITTKYPTIQTIVLNFNTKNTNVIYGEKNEVIYGDGYIRDILGDYQFMISPLSFYQVNSVQAEAMYQIAIEHAHVQPEDIALDLYGGIGTIGIFVSRYVKQVYGIEIIPSAVRDARQNAMWNQIHNIEFFCGDVAQILPQLLADEKKKPNVIFVDPPRKGLDEQTIQTIKQVNPEKLVYISCNPATLARDLKALEECYEVKFIQPVDLFPFTKHVEVVTCLERK